MPKYKALYVIEWKSKAAGWVLVPGTWVCFPNRRSALGYIEAKWSEDEQREFKFRPARYCRHPDHKGEA